jgi:hypothetical protein
MRWPQRPGETGCGTTDAFHLQQASASHEREEEGKAMWDILLTAGGWALFGVVAIFWVYWIELERKHLSRGDRRHLE